MERNERRITRVEFELFLFTVTDVAPQTTGKIESETARYLSAASAISDRRYRAILTLSCIVI